MHNTRDSFGSKFGAIAALAGSAVGLGNIWKFPYEVGNNGGGAFLLVYIFFTVAIGLPVMPTGTQNSLALFRGTGSSCSHDDSLLLRDDCRMDIGICL